MQPKYTHNKSSIIKITEDAKRKSRHRLIGSIILLFIALLILLNVTAKVKPIPINPEIVEVNNTAESKVESFTSLKHDASQALASGVNSSAPISATPFAAQNQARAATNPVVASQVISSTNKANASMGNGFKAGVVSKITSGTDTASNNAGQASPSPSSNNTSTDTAPSPKPRKAKVKAAAIDPADILNDITLPASADNGDSNVAASSLHSYIQFAALSSSAKADQLQQVLATHGVNATIIPIETARGTLYRLRAGPFTKNAASAKLQQMKDAGYNGIVTSK